MKREVLSSAQLLRRRQKPGESVDDFVRDDYLRSTVRMWPSRVHVLKRDVFVQGLLLKWQEKVLPSATTFADALHQARTAEEQERQLGLMHHGGGGTSSGTSSTVRADEPEDPSDQCQRLQCEWVDAEFSRLAEVYSQGASVDTVSSALGPLYYATVSIAGSSVDALVDPGSSATIMSFDLFRMVGKGAGIPREAMRKPEITLRDYSRRLIPIFAVVDLEFEWQGNRLTAPVYLKSDQGPKGEPCLLGTNVVIPLGLMVPGPGVRPQEVGAGDAGTVRLVSAQRGVWCGSGCYH